MNIVTPQESTLLISDFGISPAFSHSPFSLSLLRRRQFCEPRESMFCPKSEEKKKKKERPSTTTGDSLPKGQGFRGREERLGEAELKWTLSVLPR